MRARSILRVLKDSERQELQVSVGRGCGDVEEGRANERGGTRQAGYGGGLLLEALARDDS